MPGQGTVRAASGVIIFSFILALLYFARTVFEPLAIAVLLAFVLTPPTRWLRRHHVGRRTSRDRCSGLRSYCNRSVRRGHGIRR